MEAAKRKTFWLWWIASAIVLSLPAHASSVDVLHGKTRAELSAEYGQFSVERQALNPINATRYYDSFGEVTSDSSVAPKGLLANAGRVGADDIVRGLSGKNFAQKVTSMRALLSEAKQGNAAFKFVEAVGENAEVVFIGAGRMLPDGKIVKNVIVIARDGKVTRMTVDALEHLGKFPTKVRIKPGWLGRSPSS